MSPFSPVHCLLLLPRQLCSLGTPVGTAFSPVNPAPLQPATCTQVPEEKALLLRPGARRVHCAGMFAFPRARPEDAAGGEAGLCPAAERRGRLLRPQEHIAFAT